MSDEHVDYASLSVDELIGVADHVDRDAFPDVAALIDAEVAKRLPRVRSAEETAFDAAIERHLRWRLTLFVSCLGMLPLEMIVGWPLTKLTASRLPFAAVALTCMAAFSFSGLKLGMFTCPRCNQPFTRKRHFKNPFTSSCLNCGLTRTR